MSYEKTEWKNKLYPDLDAAHLNKMEQGIYQASSDAENALNIGQSNADGILKLDERINLMDGVRAFYPIALSTIKAGATESVETSILIPAPSQMIVKAVSSQSTKLKDLEEYGLKLNGLNVEFSNGLVNKIKVEVKNTTTKDVRLNGAIIIVATTKL